MGVVADRVMAHGGKVIGIIPDALMQKEVGHRGLTELHVVRNMHERKQMMADLADAFIAMPGGVGTFEELFETFTWAQLGYHDKPVGLLNVAGFYDGMLGFLNHAVGEGFLKQVHADMLHVSAAPADLLAKLAAAPRVVVDKWQQARDKT